MRSETVRIRPVEGVTLHGWKPVEQEVTAEDWAELREYTPAPFIVIEPEEQPAPDQEIPADG